MSGLTGWTLGRWFFGRMMIREIDTLQRILRAKSVAEARALATRIP